MTRRTMLQCVLGAPMALAHSRVMAARRRDGGVGGVSYVHPARLTEDMVDTAMWPLVRRINASGWVWTTESCSGGDHPYPAVLGLATDDLERLVATVEAIRNEAPIRFERNPGGPGAELMRRQQDGTLDYLGQFTLAVVGRPQGAAGQRRVLEAFDRLAVEVSR